jgi:hypothetical protein
VFPRSYFAGRYFAPRFYPQSRGEAPALAGSLLRLLWGRGQACRPLGAARQSLDVLLVDDAGLPLTGLVAATFPAVRWSRAGAHPDQALALWDLPSLTAAWSDGGVRERGGGRYRLDLPDAVFEAQGEVSVRGEAGGKHLLAPWIEVIGSSRVH